jgi:DNA-binding SARP family transcriptional activator
MRFRLLGSLEVAGPQRALPEVAPRQRVVLAMLTLEANRIVSIERLITAVWDDDPPATAREQIQICVSRLRRLLGVVGLAGVIKTRSPGYVLYASEHQIDLRVFEELGAAAREASGRGRTVEAVEMYRRALALWRGEPLAGLTSRLLRSVASRLVERYLTMVEEYSEARLALGDHQALAAELAEQVAVHPLREKLRLQLMLALFRCGLRAEALECYRRTRDTFVEELGLEPGVEFLRLERAILVGEESATAKGHAARSGVDNGAATPRQLPADCGDFVGRREFLLWVQDALAPAGPGTNTPVVALFGGMGIGKTTLAVHAGHELSGAFPDGQLYASLAGSSHRPADPHAVLKRFLQAVGVPDDGIPGQLDERAALFRSRVADRRILVVLDDAADENQVAQVLPGDSRVAVLITSRVRLTALPGACHMELDALDPDSAAELVARVPGVRRTDAEREHTRQLVELCGRWPLALRVVAARLAARQHWTVGHLVERLSNEPNRLNELVHGPLDIRKSIASGYDRLRPAEQRMFRLLATLPSGSFPAWLAARAAGCADEGVEDLLERLVDAHLVRAERRNGLLGAFRVPSLFRLYAAERLNADESRQTRDGAISRALDAWLYLIEEADRRVFGGDPTVAGESDDPSRLSGDLVDALLADPVRWYAGAKPALLGAVGQAAAVGAHDTCGRLVLAARRFILEQNDVDGWVNAGQVAVKSAQQLGHAARVTQLQRLQSELNALHRRTPDAEGSLGFVERLLEEVSGTDDQVTALKMSSLARIREMLDEIISRAQPVYPPRFKESTATIPDGAARTAW